MRCAGLELHQLPSASWWELILKAVLLVQEGELRPMDGKKLEDIWLSFWHTPSLTWAPSSESGFGWRVAGLNHVDVGCSIHQG